MARARARAMRCRWPPDELGRVAVGEVGDLDEREELADLAPDLVLGALADGQAEGHVVPDRHVLEGRVVLEDEADAALLRRHVRDVPVAEADAALLGHLEPADDAQQRRLAAARRSQQRRQRAVGDLQRDVVEDDDVAEALRRGRG